MYEKSGPLKMIRTKGLAQAQKLKTLHFYILVIQDHIESIGKANTIKEGVRCCLMSFFLKVLSDMLQKPSTTSSHPHMSQTKSQTRPHQNFVSGATEFS